MALTTRRGFLGTSGTAIFGLALAPKSAEAAYVPSYKVIEKNAEQYSDLCQGTNLRWVGAPDRIAFPLNAEDVAAEVRVIQQLKLKAQIRSGGHCYEDFVANDNVKAIIDLSAVNQVRWDPQMRAYEIGAGAQLGDVYQRLYKQWGVYLPGGNCPTVAAGGHIAGGGYGSQNRRDGLISDHLYAIEVVHVTDTGAVRVIRATREKTDPNRDLWWAYTGGGGGNFGVAVRYWMRSSGVSDPHPDNALPKPPRDVWINTVAWNWDDIDEAGFNRLMRNHGRWHEENSTAGTPEAKLFSQLKPWHRSMGSITMDTVVDATIKGAESICQSYIAAVSDGVGTPITLQHRKVPWMQSTQWTGFTGPDATRRFDGKSAYLRKNWSDEMLKGAWDGLNDPNLSGSAALLMIASYGGAVNRLGADETAVPQRDSIIKFQVVSIWDNPEDDASNVTWTRSTYAAMFASTGKVPALGAITDGAFVNYCDTDLDDPQWNTSGLTSGQLYYKHNLQKLKDIRTKYDPTEFFSHAQSL